MFPHRDCSGKLARQRRIALQIKRSMRDPELIIGRRPFHLKRDASYLYGFMRVQLDKPSSNGIVARQCFWLPAKLKTLSETIRISHSSNVYLVFCRQERRMERIPLSIEKFWRKYYISNRKKTEIILYPFILVQYCNVEDENKIIKLMEQMPYFWTYGFERY